jgi:2-polyprenyl-3-methyl-5-hydroxy-6-metoxy-1,4-benzoquinol methylase
MFTDISINQVQEYWNRRPCNIRHSSKSTDTVEYFDECKDKRYFVEPHIPVWAGFSDWSGKKVLELGSGIGSDAVQFGLNGAKVTCTDLSEKSLELCQKNFALHGLDQVNFFHGNLEKLSEWLPVEKYDLIYSFGVIHHTPNPERVISGMINYCHPETVVKIMLYNRFSYKLFWVMKEEELEWNFGNLDKIIAEHSEAQTGCPVTYTYTEESARKLLEPHFEIVEVKKDHIFPYEISAYKRGEYVADKWFEGMSQEDFDSMKRDLGWHLMITCKPKF